MKMDMIWQNLKGRFHILNLFSPIQAIFYFKHTFSFEHHLIQFTILSL